MMRVRSVRFNRQPAGLEAHIGSEVFFKMCSFDVHVFSFMVSQDDGEDTRTAPNAQVPRSRIAALTA